MYSTTQTTNNLKIEIALMEGLHKMNVKRESAEKTHIL